MYDYLWFSMSGVGKFLDRSALTPTLLLVLVRLIKESLRSELITPFFDVIIQVSTLILPVDDFPLAQDIPT